MAYSFTGLTSYTDQERLPLITKAVFSARSAALFTKQVGIKFAAALNLMDTDAQLQSGDACGYTTSGTTAFTQRNITVGRMKVQETLCPRSLEQYWMQTQLTAGSNYERCSLRAGFLRAEGSPYRRSVGECNLEGQHLLFRCQPVVERCIGFYHQR